MARPGGSEDVCVLHKDFVVETSVIVLENQGPLGVSFNHPSIRCLKVGHGLSFSYRLPFVNRILKFPSLCGAEVTHVLVEVNDRLCRPPHDEVRWSGPHLSDLFQQFVVILLHLSGDDAQIRILDDVIQP